MPEFRDSRDVMELLFSGKIADKTRVDCFAALRHTSETFHEAHNFLTVLRIGSHVGSALWNIQHILWLIYSFKQHDGGEILVSFQGRWTRIYYFSDSQNFNEVLDIFPRLSHRLIFIMLNVGMVDNLEFW